jgi:LysM domain
MPTIEIPKTVTGKQPKHRKMLIVSEQGQRVTLPYAPVEVTHDEIGMGFAQLERPGRTPLLEKTGRRLPTMTMTVIVAEPDGRTSVEPILASIRELATAGDRVTVAYGRSEAGWWRITKMGIASVQRSPGTNDIAFANVTLEFQRADETVIQKVGPLSGGASGVGLPSASSKSGTTVVVKKGETLTQISARVYGTPSRWTEIAKANNIKDPRKVPAGAKLTIP